MLIAGGQDSTSTSNAPVLSSAELFDPTGGASRGGAFSAVPGSMIKSRSSHTAFYLDSGTNSGKVLLAGGRTNLFDTYDDGSELFNPSTGSFTGYDSIPILVPPPTPYRLGMHETTLLSDGKLLVLGGRTNGSYSSLASLYDPQAISNSFATMNAFTGWRVSHTATLLTTGSNSGKVLIIGGYDGTFLNSQKFYDPSSSSSGSDTLAPIMPTGRRGKHTATRLLDGRIFICGGQSTNIIFLSTALIYARVSPFLACLLRS